MDVQFLPELPTAKGFDYKISLIHLATRLKYSEIHDHQRSETLAQVLERAQQRLPLFFLVFTDNQAAFTMARTAWPERVTLFTRRCGELGIRHALLPVASPWRNGCIERSNRTDKEELFSKVVFENNDERRYQLALWELEYNTRRPHQGIGNETPMQRCAKIHPTFAATCSLN